MRQAYLYFVAAALFLVAGAISTVRDGLSIRTIVGLVLGAVMLAWGLKARRGGA